MSFRVLIKSDGVAEPFAAPAWFSTVEEAQAFGKLSVQVLGWYCRLEAWKIERCERPANYTFDGASLIQLNRC